jgi:hypothetical protein
LPPGELTEEFLTRLCTFLNVERLDVKALDRLLDHLTLNDDPRRRHERIPRLTRRERRPRTERATDAPPR